MQNHGVLAICIQADSRTYIYKQHDSRRQVDATTLSNFDLVHDPCVPITDSCMHINLHELAITRPVLFVCESPQFRAFINV